MVYFSFVALIQRLGCIIYLVSVDDSIFYKVSISILHYDKSKSKKFLKRLELHILFNNTHIKDLYHPSCLIFTVLLHSTLKLFIWTFRKSLDQTIALLTVMAEWPCVVIIFCLVSTLTTDTVLACITELWSALFVLNIPSYCY